MLFYIVGHREKEGRRLWPALTNGTMRRLLSHLCVGMYYSIGCETSKTTAEESERNAEVILLSISLVFTLVRKWRSDCGGRCCYVCRMVSVSSHRIVITYSPKTALYRVLPWVEHSIYWLVHTREIIVEVDRECNN